MSNPVLDNASKEELYEEIERLRYVLALISLDYLELSHHKIKDQRDYYKKIAKEFHDLSMKWEIDIIFKTCNKEPSQ